MKTEGYYFGFNAVFLAVCDVVYWYLSKDPTGTAALTLAGALTLLISGYLLFTARRMEPRPEDRGDADIAEGAGEIGHFSPSSYWPFGVALGAALVFLGVALGVWLSVIGAVLVVVTASGLIFEHDLAERGAQRQPGH